jgi:hypothetical protein
MSMLESFGLEERERLVPDPGAITLADWLAADRSASPRVALQLITRIANALHDAHQHGVRHGALTAEEVVLSGWSSSSFGTPALVGFAPSIGAWPRREDVAADVAGLAGIAQALLLPAPQPARGKRVAPTQQQLGSSGRRSKAAGAVIAAGMDRREGVFVFESPLDFVVAVEAALAADADTVTAPDPALRAMQQRRRRRRVIKLVAGTAVACLALLVVSNATADRPHGAEKPAACAGSR